MNGIQFTMERYSTENTQEVGPIARRRIEFDPDEVDSETAALIEGVRALLAAQRDGEQLAAVSAAGVIERAAHTLTGTALLAAARTHGGTRTRAELAAAFSRWPDAINRRITETQEGLMPGEKTVAGCRVAPGDLVTDPSGDYAGYGPIAEVHRQGVSTIATCHDGTRLSFLPFDRVRVARGGGQ